MAGEGYFISPRGDIIEVKTFHINEVLSEPEKFGFSNAEIDSLYEKYHEGRGHEGKARKEILAKVLANRWIRIRHYSRSDQYYVEAGNYSSKTQEYLQGFAEYLLPATYEKLTSNSKEKPKIKDIGHPNSEVIVSTLEIKKDTQFDENGEPINVAKKQIGTFSLLQLLKYAHYEKAASSKTRIKLTKISISEYKPTQLERKQYILSNINFVFKPLIEKIKIKLSIDN